MRVRSGRFRKLRSTETGYTQPVGPCRIQNRVQEHPAVAPPAAGVGRHWCSNIRASSRSQQFPINSAAASRLRPPARRVSFRTRCLNARPSACWLPGVGSCRWAPPRSCSPGTCAATRSCTPLHPSGLAPVRVRPCRAHTGKERPPAGGPSAAREFLPVANVMMVKSRCLLKRTIC